MRVHVQSAAGEASRPITPRQWSEAVARANASHSVSFGDTKADFAAGMIDAEALVVITSALPPLLPLHAPCLKVIYCTSAGLERLSPFDWLPEGVALLNNSGTHAVKGAEYVTMAILMIANAMPSFIADQQGRRWEKRLGRSISGQHLTVLGLGALGGAVAERASALGMTVTGVRTNPEPHPHCAQVVTLNELRSILPETDYVALTLPLTPATRHVLDRDSLALLRPTAGVINIGRGGLIDQGALCDRLDGGFLAGAVLDVFEQEPVPADARVWSTRNLIMTPHMSADDPMRYNEYSLDIFLKNMRLLELGLPMPNRYDITLGY